MTMADEMNTAKGLMPYLGRMTHFCPSMRGLGFEGVLANHSIERTSEEHVALFDKLVPAPVNNKKETEDD